MTDVETLRKRRDSASKREDHVQKLIRGERLDIARLVSELDDERDERDELQNRRHELKRAIEAEIKADQRGKGEHPDKWEDWAESRRDELADLIDASEARILLLIEHSAKSESEKEELAKRREHLRDKIKVLERRIEHKAEPAGQLTKDFHVAEFDCHDGTPVPAGIIGDLKELCAEHLQPLRDSGGVVGINSGFRTASYNASIGGATQSYHIYDLRMAHPAADHVQSGRSAPSVQAWHDSHNPPDGMGYYAGFTHIDDRGYRSRWWGAA